MDNRKIGVRSTKPDKVSDTPAPTYNEVKRSLKYKPRGKLVDFIFHQCAEMTGTPMFAEGQRDELMKMSKGQLAKVVLSLAVERQIIEHASQKIRWYDWIPLVVLYKVIARKLKLFKRSRFVKRFYSVHRKVSN